ncbi:MAG: SRPBCC domain-containing protein [Ornithinimicrobium sp.]
MDPVFKALADPTRRSLLDALHEQDGQPLGALAARFTISRIAVAKHLGILEASGVITTTRRGREKLHFLNPVPIRLIHDRWVSKFTEAWAVGLIGLRDEMEHTMERVFEIYIRATPERLWEAITDPQIRAKYHFGTLVTSQWAPGSTWTQEAPGRVEGRVSEGEVLEADPPRRLVHTIRSLWGPEVIAEGSSRVTWQIEPVGDSCRLTLTHDELREGANEQVYGGWPMILSGLKTWLETGETLTTPGSLMYAGQG